MTRCQAPPGRTSALQETVVKPRGPHQRVKCSGIVQARKTSRRGASRRRVITSSCSRVAAASVVAVMRRLRLLQFVEVIGEAVEAFLPEPAIGFEPDAGVLQRFGREAARSP